MALSLQPQVVVRGASVQKVPVQVVHVLAHKGRGWSCAVKLAHDGTIVQRTFDAHTLSRVLNQCTTKGVKAPIMTWRTRADKLVQTGNARRRNLCSAS